MPDRGSYCFNEDMMSGGFGVTTPLGTLDSRAMPSVPPGATVYGTATVVVHGTQSTTDHCGNSPSSVPMTVTCEATGAQIKYNESNFYYGDVLTMPCPPGSNVQVDHTANGTTCCFGGCGRTYNISLVADINPCGTTS